MERCVSGLVYRPGEGWEQGWILHDGARVVETGQGRPPRAPEREGVVLPSLIDAHTHVGDRVARGAELTGLTLAQVVAPPDGLKHKLLRGTPREKLVAGMRDALAEAASQGASRVADFREQGEDGVAMLREASRGAAPQALAFGRCAGLWDAEEARRVLALADGYGLSGLGDSRADVPEQAAAEAHRVGKPFALHLSEDRREDAARAVTLRPAFVVHAVHATRDDAKLLADARVPVVTCPRSNARFGLRLDVPRMIEAGVTLALGSDNAMLHELGALHEARHLARAWPELPPETILDMAIVGGRVALDGGAPRSWLRLGDAADLVVFERRGSGVASLFGDPEPRRL